VRLGCGGVETCSTGLGSNVWRTMMSSGLSENGLSVPRRFLAIMVAIVGGFKAEFSGGHLPRISWIAQDAL
jgi:hypothetical protein